MCNFLTKKDRAYQGRLEVSQNSVEELTGLDLGRYLSYSKNSKTNQKLWVPAFHRRSNYHCATIIDQVQGRLNILSNPPSSPNPPGIFTFLAPMNFERRYTASVILVHGFPCHGPYCQRLNMPTFEKTNFI